MSVVQRRISATQRKGLPEAAIRQVVFSDGESELDYPAY